MGLLDWLFGDGDGDSKPSNETTDESTNEPKKQNESPVHEPKEEIQRPDFENEPLEIDTPAHEIVESEDSGLFSHDTYSNMGVGNAWSDSTEFTFEFPSLSHGTEFSVSVPTFNLEVPDISEAIPAYEPNLVIKNESTQNPLAKFGIQEGEPAIFNPQTGRFLPTAKNLLVDVGRSSLKCYLSEMDDTEVDRTCTFAVRDQLTGDLSTRTETFNSLERSYNLIEGHYKNDGNGTLTGRSIVKDYSTERTVAYDVTSFNDGTYEAVPHVLEPGKKSSDFSKETGRILDLAPHDFDQIREADRALPIDVKMSAPRDERTPDPANEKTIQQKPENKLAPTPERTIDPKKLSDILNKRIDEYQLEGNQWGNGGDGKYACNIFVEKVANDVWGITDFTHPDTTILKKIKRTNLSHANDFIEYVKTDKDNWEEIGDLTEQKNLNKMAEYAAQGRFVMMGHQTSVKPHIEGGHVAIARMGKPQYPSTVWLKVKKTGGIKLGKLKLPYGASFFKGRGNETVKKKIISNIFSNPMGVKIWAYKKK